MPRRPERGFTLIEVLTVISIIGIIALTALPAFATHRRRAAARAAASEVRSVLQKTRSRAIARGHNAGVRFASSAGTWTYTIHDDGDRDGVRNDDIRKGIDRAVTRSMPVLHYDRAAAIGLPPFKLVGPDGEVIKKGSSPVRFNTSQLCSFSPLGESTSGTIYLTDGQSEIYAVRVYGGSAKIRTLRYDASAKRWVP